MKIPTFKIEIPKSKDEGINKIVFCESDFKFKILTKEELNELDKIKKDGLRIT